MTLDHAGAFVDPLHFWRDGPALYEPGRAIDTGRFATRWITHLCAPTFLFLAGVCLSLALERRSARGDSPGSIDRYLLSAGALPGGARHHRRQRGDVERRRNVRDRLPGPVRDRRELHRHDSPPASTGDRDVRRRSGAGGFHGAGGVSLLGSFVPPSRPVSSTRCSTRRRVPRCATRRRVHRRVLPPLRLAAHAALRLCLRAVAREARASPALLVAGGVASLVVFAIVRGQDGYGHFGLHPEVEGPIGWLYVSKYPPSITYTAATLGLCALSLAVATILARRSPGARRLLEWLALFGRVPLFFYVVHLPVVLAAAWLSTGSPRRGTRLDVRRRDRVSPRPLPRVLRVRTDGVSAFSFSWTVSTERGRIPHSFVVRPLGFDLARQAILTQSLPSSRVHESSRQSASSSRNLARHRCRRASTRPERRRDSGESHGDLRDRRAHSPVG